MWLGIISLFPEMFSAVADYGITRRAIQSGLLSLDYWNPRDFTSDKHRTVDDKPYGGGPGMLMKVEPLRDAINAARQQAGKNCRVIYLSPQGQKLDQQALVHLSTAKKLILIAGRYEGIDERIIEQEVDAQYSIGDYVLSGGELPAMVLVDGITRLLPGAVGDPESVVQDSFTEGLLDYPQYTRPEEVDGKRVPAVLLNGDHQAISRWRSKQAIGRTFEHRPDLIKAMDLNEQQKELLDEYCLDNDLQYSN